MQLLFGDSTTQALHPAQHHGELRHVCSAAPNSSPTSHVGHSLCRVPGHRGDKDGLILVLHGLHKQLC